MIFFNMAIGALVWIVSVTLLTSTLVSHETGKQMEQVKAFTVQTKENFIALNTAQSVPSEKRETSLSTDSSDQSKLAPAADLVSEIHLSPQGQDEREDEDD